MTDTTLKTVQALVEALELKMMCEPECVCIGREALADGVALIAQMQRDAVQPGWKLVPKEPTPEMLEAMKQAVWMGDDAMYRAALDAAPHPEAQALDSQLQQPDGHSTPCVDAASTTPAPELDAAGAPKLPLTVLERVAVDACNQIKAWADSDSQQPLPEQTRMLVDCVLMVAAQRRKGVQ